MQMILIHLKILNVLPCFFSRAFFICGSFSKFVKLNLKLYKMKKLLLIPLMLFLLSCSKEQSYKYVEHIKDTNVGGKLADKTVEEEIKAKNDTLAFIKAYSKFKISQRLKEHSKSADLPYQQEAVSFQLINEKGKDITDIDFKTKKLEIADADEYALNIVNPYERKEGSRANRAIYQEVKINPCVMSEDFIKRDLRYPNTANFSIFNCSSEQNSDGSYTVLRKVSAKNAFGAESEFIYKVRIGFTGGNEVDINNWKLIGIISEEYRP